MPFSSEQLATRLEQLCPTLSFAYLFGSQASGRQRADSDIDIAIFTTEPLSAQARWQLTQQLAREWNREVDIVDLRRCSTVLRMQIVTEGRVIIDKHRQTPAFDTTTISMYQHLQESRAGLIEDFVKKATHDRH